MGEKSLLWTLTTNIFYTGSYSGGNLGGFSCKKKHDSWDLQWIIEAKIPSYEILSQASVGETLNATSFTFPDPLRSWRLVSLCTSKKTSRLFLFELKLRLNQVSLCHKENLSLDLAILMCRNFLYWHSVFPVAKGDSEASRLFLLSALFLLHSYYCCC